MMGGGSIAVAAALAVFGLPVERYLTTSDGDERLVLGALAREASTLVDKLQRNAATHIANAMVKAKL
jgi:hypothetical protein